MKISHWSIHALLALGLAALLYAAFWLLLMLAFGGYELLALSLPAAFIALYLGFWLHISLPLGRRRISKWLLILLAAAVAAIIAAIAYKEYRRAQYHSVPAVREFNLSDYRPFHSDKLAVLNRPAELQLTEHLPVLDGSTALYPLYAALVQAVYPPQLAEQYAELDRLIQSSKTGNAYQRLLDGEVDIIFVPAPSQTHQALADSKGRQFQLYPIGQEAFVFFVHPSNPVENLSVAQIQQIYAGNITRWQEVGGNHDRIRAFQRPENSGSQTALQKLMGDVPIMPALREEVVEGMGGIIERVADYRNFPDALGFSFLLYSSQLLQDKQIKHLSINGIAPNQANIRDKTYPFTYDFYAVTLGNESAETRQLINWLQSPQGKALIEKTGYVPAP